MALPSYGFNGVIPEQAWAFMAPLLGSDWTYGTGGGDLLPSKGVGDRAMQIAPGWSMSHGVASNVSAATMIALAPITSGTRWDTICVRRDWQPDSPDSGGTAELVAVQGTSALALAGGMKKEPGRIEDQPVALAQVAAGKTDVQAFIDLRRWGLPVYTCKHPLAIPTPYNGQIASIDSVPMVYRSKLARWDTLGAIPFYSAQPTSDRAAIAFDAKGFAKEDIAITLSIPDPGYPYKIRVGGQIVATAAAGTRVDFYARVNDYPLSWTYIQSMPPGQEIPQAIPQYHSKAMTGPGKVTLVTRRISGTGAATLQKWSTLTAEVIPA